MLPHLLLSSFFFFNDTATTEIYTLSLHDALPISWLESVEVQDGAAPFHDWNERVTAECYAPNTARSSRGTDRKSTRLNSSHSQISYAVFCLKKKKKNIRKSH